VTATSETAVERGAASGRRLRVGVLTGPALCSRHGTGVQILRIFEDANVDFWHLFWLGTAGYDSDHSASAFLGSLPRLRRLRGGRNYWDARKRYRHGLVERRSG